MPSRAQIWEKRGFSPRRNARPVLDSEDHTVFAARSRAKKSFPVSRLGVLASGSPYLTTRWPGRMTLPPRELAFPRVPAH